MRKEIKKGLRKTSQEVISIKGSLKKKKTCKFSDDGQHDFQLNCDGFWYRDCGPSAYDYYLKEVQEEKRKLAEEKEGGERWHGMFRGKVLVQHRCSKCGKKELHSRGVEEFPFPFKKK